MEGRHHAETSDVLPAVAVGRHELEETCLHFVLRHIQPLLVNEPLLQLQSKPDGIMVAHLGHREHARDEEAREHVVVNGCVRGFGVLGQPNAYLDEVIFGP